jgi:hypothetical protein
MPKSAGADMKTIRVPSRAQPASRSINHQTPPAPGPHRNPPSAGGQPASNDVAADAVRIAASPGGIYPKQH